MKSELKDECDYVREAHYLQMFAAPGFLGASDMKERFQVPWVWDGSTKDVLVMERVGGVSVGSEDVMDLSQDVKNDIAERVIELCLRECFEWRAMQTDPNWSNFLWNDETGKVWLSSLAQLPYKVLTKVHFFSLAFAA